MRQRDLNEMENGRDVNSEKSCEEANKDEENSIMLGVDLSLKAASSFFPILKACYFSKSITRHTGI